MMQDIFMYMLLAMISFFPMVVWAYVFSHMDDNPLNKKSFIIWMVWGSLSVIPMLYMDKMMDFFSFDKLNVFYFVSEMKWFFSSLEFWVSLSLFLFMMVLLSFLLWWFIWKSSQLLKMYLKNVLVFLFFMLFLTMTLFWLNYLMDLVDFDMEKSVSFWNIVFDTFKLIMFYYLIVAFIEETSKHFNFLQSSVFYIKSMKDWVLYAMFVALWFWFMENMLYLYNYYLAYWLGWELLKLFFFRSSFSMIVHVLSSSVVAYYFSKALLLYSEKDLSLPYLKMFSFGLLTSMLLHLFFDVALTLWFTFMMFMYFMWWYLYVSSIFYKE